MCTLYEVKLAVKQVNVIKVDICSKTECKRFA